MPLVTLEEARTASRRAVLQKSMTVEAMLRESRETASAASTYDFFLSHSAMDRDLVLGAKAILEGKNFSVYVDWLQDPLLDRTKVTKDSAATIRRRMRQCTYLVYVHTPNAADSKWCPWELGYFDAFSHGKDRVLIFPLVSVAGATAFKGQEYLGLYPYIRVDQPLSPNRNTGDVTYHEAA